MFNAKAYSASSATSLLAPRTIPRRDPTGHDVQIEILFCGICHSDLHYARDEWHSIMPSVYPCVPGHEIAGRVTKVGSAVTKFKPGNLAGVGCLVDSDHTCPHCQAGLEQFCPNQILTYGGYSDSIVVDERFVLRIPTNLDPAGVAPLHCAGITTYSPMRRWGVIKGRKVGVVGLGGLGHMGVKFARTFEAHVVVFTTSPGKTEDALRLGADEVVVSRNDDEMKKHAGSFDFILGSERSSRVPGMTWCSVTRDVTRRWKSSRGMHGETREPVHRVRLRRRRTLSCWLCIGPGWTTCWARQATCRAR